jgi:pseudaminic acid biosynthesis-associated methylase
MENNLSMTYKTEQEAFWAGNFGDSYIARNSDQMLLASNLALFSKILARTQSIKTVLELGANVGLNLRAIQSLVPNAEMSAVEINAKAVEQLQAIGDVNIFHGSILDFKPTETYDLVFTKGVLIHINPEFLPAVYQAMYKASDRYILIAEYYNPSPVEVSYRGFGEKLFKRDFAGEMLDSYPDLSLIDYGFAYRRDSHFPQDDTNWFLLEKTS